MPEIRFTIRWPDGTPEHCYSPSLVIKDYLTPGEAYLVGDFLTRSRAALAIGSERARAKFGFACSRAAGQLACIEASCERFLDQAGAKVRVESFHEQQGHNS